MHAGLGRSPFLLGSDCDTCFVILSAASENDGAWQRVSSDAVSVGVAGASTVTVPSAELAVRDEGPGPPEPNQSSLVGFPFAGDSGQERGDRARADVFPARWPWLRKVLPSGSELGFLPRCEFVFLVVQCEVAFLSALGGAECQPNGSLMAKAPFVF